MSVAVRQLRPDDWIALREVRLSALRDRPGSFATTAEAVEAVTEEDWRQFLDNRQQAAFGLFAETSLIGITAIFTDRDDPSAATGLLGMTWLNPAWRGKGLSRLIYEVRMEWARARALTRVRVSHRDGNEPSRRAMIAHGFAYVGRTSVQWPDGHEADEIHYELRLM